MKKIYVAFILVGSLLTTTPSYADIRSKEERMADDAKERVYQAELRGEDPLGKFAVPVPVQNEDCGKFPDNYEELVKTYFSNTLLDPYSAHYRFVQPYKAGYRPGRYMAETAPEIYEGGKIQFGYMIEVWINAKNRYGGYVGEKFSRLFLYKDGTVRRLVFKDDREWRPYPNSK